MCSGALDQLGELGQSVPRFCVSGACYFDEDAVVALNNERILWLIVSHGTTPGLAARNQLTLRRPAAGRQASEPFPTAPPLPARKRNP